jgi:hypothetical protein
MFDASSGDSDVETVEVAADLKELRHRLKVDGEFFIDFFLGDQLDLPVPELHKDVWERIKQAAERILLAIPRDHAKTTLSKLSVVWHWLFTKHRFTVYLSNTNTIAKGACKDIVEYLKHPNFVATFGKVKIIKESEGESLWIYDLPMPGGKWKRIILRAIGQGQQMRGINIDNQRPDFAVVDDVEDNENTESPPLQKKLDKWIFGPFIKALARKKKIVWLGNMLQKTSLLARLSRNPKWNPVVYGCLVKDAQTGQLKPLWPGKWTLEALQEDFKEYKDLGLIETWMCEMMNMPGHGENGFTQENLNYQAVPTPDAIKAAWITIDPAFGTNEHNDESSIAVHVIPEDGVPMTVAVSHGHFDEVRLFNEAFSLAQYWGAWVWGIEAVAAQRVLIPLFNIFLAQKMMNHHVELLPLMAGRGDPKAGRIRAFAGLMSNNEWAIPDSDVDITTQMLAYSFKVKDQRDDIIDSCAYGPMMMETYLAIIMAGFNQQLESFGSARFGMEVASV